MLARVGSYLGIFMVCTVFMFLSVFRRDNGAVFVWGGEGKGRRLHDQSSIVLC